MRLVVYRLLALFFLGFSAFGCGGPNAPPGDSCPATSTQIGKVEHPADPSHCVLLVTMCNYCEYDESYRLVDEGDQPCGVCTNL